MTAPDALPQYTPRWLYRFFAFIERLPGPAWALALFVIVVNGLVAHWVAWSQGALPFGQGHVLLTAMGLFAVTGLAQWHYLTLSARPAIEGFFKGRKSPAKIEAILADFVSLPSFWGTLIFIWGAITSIYGFKTVMNPLVPISAEVLPGWGMVISILGGGFIFVAFFRIMRQSVLAQRFYAATDVDLFNPSPFYALTRFAVANLVAVLLGTYLLQGVTLPEIMFSPIGLLFQILFSCLLLLFFFAQLVGVNRRMRQAKERLLSEVGKDIEKIYNKVHKAVKADAFATVGRLQASVATLKNEQEIIQKIPTWPWQPETLRNLLTPMLLPVIVYLIQRFLGSALGF